MKIVLVFLRLKLGSSFNINLMNLNIALNNIGLKLKNKYGYCRFKYNKIKIIHLEIIYQKIWMKFKQDSINFFPQFCLHLLAAQSY